MVCFVVFFSEWLFTVLYKGMSMCDDTLLCNFPKCRAKLTGFAWVTACSHVFCDQHGSEKFGRSPVICPACSSALSGKLDILRMELSPSEEYKAMVLTGLRPDIVLDISSRALAFWSYQVKYLHVNNQYKIRQMWEKLPHHPRKITFFIRKIALAYVMMPCPSDQNKLQNVSGLFLSTFETRLIF